MIPNTSVGLNGLIKPDFKFNGEHASINEVYQQHITSRIPLINQQLDPRLLANKFTLNPMNSIFLPQSELIKDQNTQSQQAIFLSQMLKQKLLESSLINFISSKKIQAEQAQIHQLRTSTSTKIEVQEREDHIDIKTKKIKKFNTCGHRDRPHYAKNMCNQCYHKYGRQKKPWLCNHDKLYAHGLCQNCYINNYNKKRTEKRNQNKKTSNQSEKNALQTPEETPEYIENSPVGNNSSN